MAFNLFVRAENTSLSTLPKNWWSLKFYSNIKDYRIEGILGLPEKPKRPVGMFFKYVEDNVKTSSGTLKRPELLKVLGEKWNKLSDKEKEKYHTKYQIELAEYKKKLEEYENSLTESEKEDLKRMKSELKRAKSKEACMFSKSEIKNVLQKPVKPMSSFLRFVSETAPKGSKADLREISQQWMKLPPEKKEKYVQQTEKEMEEYLEDLKKWEIKMFQEGKMNLIRLKTLKMIS